MDLTTATPEERIIAVEAMNLTEIAATRNDAEATVKHISHLAERYDVPTLIMILTSTIDGLGQMITMLATEATSKP